MPLNPNDKLAIAREYENTHLRDIERATEDGMEILMREIFSRRKDQTRKYADQIAIRIDLKDPMLDITDKKSISTYIRQKYRQYGVPETIINNISGDLPEEYKNAALAREQLVSANGDQLIADSTPEVKKMDNLRLQNEDEKLAEDEKKAKAELSRIRDVRTIIQEEAAERHMQLESMRSDTINTPWAKEEDNEFSQLLVKIGNGFISIGMAARKVELSPEDAERYAQVASTWYDVVEHAADVKHTKTMQGWLKTIRTYEDFGKHAAAVKEGITSISGVKRPLTREQVGDKAPEILDAAMRILDMEHLLAVVAEYHRKYVEPRIAERKVALHDTLSEKA